MDHVLNLNMSNDAYHGDKSALSSTVIKCASSDGWSACKQMVDGLRPISTRPLVTGSAFHLACADMTAFEAQYQMAPDDFKTADSQKIQAWAKSHGTSMENVLTVKEWENAVGMATAVRSKIANFRSGERWLSEASFFVKDKETGCRLKCRPDLLIVNSLEKPTIVDYIELKSAAAVRPFAVRSVFWRLGYAIQQAFYERVVCTYWDTIETIRTRFVFVESKPPYNVRIYELAAEDAIAADAKVSELVGEYRRRQLLNDWEDESIDNPTLIEMHMGSKEEELVGSEDVEMEEDSDG